MPTAKKRLNVTLPKSMAIFVQKIALRDDVPQATKIVQLLEKALEIEEDEYLCMIAESRDTKGAGTISHKEFWSKLV